MGGNEAGAFVWGCGCSRSLSGDCSPSQFTTRTLMIFYTRTTEYCKCTTIDFRFDLLPGLLFRIRCIQLSDTKIFGELRLALSSDVFPELATIGAGRETASCRCASLRIPGRGTKERSRSKQRWDSTRLGCQRPRAWPRCPSLCNICDLGVHK